MKYLFNTILLSISLISITGCGNPSVTLRTKKAIFVAKTHGYTEKIVRGGDFWLTTFQKIEDPKSPYVFYLEGDGLNINRLGLTTDNPTPSYPLMLKLAIQDKRPNVVYIARPCQYTPKELNVKCENLAYWTNLRLSDEVVSSINEVIDKTNNNQKFSLVGYSNGGGIAILIAARNNKAKDILTVAGNLDITSFNQYHNARAMIGSLNPIDYAGSVSKIPQLHVSGGKDLKVPAFIADEFIKISNSNCVHQEIFPYPNHRDGWEALWPEILAMPIKCYSK